MSEFEVKPVEDVKTRPSRRKYGGLFRQLQLMANKKDTASAVVVPIPPGVKYRTFYNRLAISLRTPTYGLQPPKGYRFSRHQSEDGKDLVITLVPSSASAEIPKPVKPDRKTLTEHQKKLKRERQRRYMENKRKKQQA